MVIVETSLFTRRVTEMLSDDDYAAIQWLLLARPDAGALIRGSGGIRKLRWGLGNRGKSGGVRVIYYWAVSRDQILMLHIYPKNEADDLTQAQMKILRRVVEDEFS